MHDIQLDQDEHITLTSYRHWINLAPPFVSSIVLLIGAGVVAYLAGRYNHKVNNLSIPTGIVMIVILLLVIFAGALIALALWVYRRNQLILTNKHLIKVEQNGLFARKVSQLGLSRVQDVNGSRNGLIPTILNFGNVEVQTAGEQEEFIFVQMPDPNGLANTLVKAHDNFADDEDGTGRVTPAPPVSTSTSPLQSPTVATEPAVAIPTVPPPPPPAEPAPSVDLPAFQMPPEEELTSATSPEPIYATEPAQTEAPEEEAPTPLSDFEPPESQPPPAPSTPNHELTENQTVQIPPPEPPAA